VPLLSDVRTGDLTFVQQARRVLRDRRAAALVVYVDSRGGSAAASEAIASSLKRVAEKKPVVVAMGAVAGSGGYYVATPGQHIVAQPATITGSIGVLGGKLVSLGLFEKLRMNRELLSRGRRAAMFDPGRPFTEEERALVRRHIERSYEVFLERVSKSRSLSRKDLDEIGGGRVWTGEQALKHGLIDELGDLDMAIEKARQLAGLDERAPVREIFPQKRALAPHQASPKDILSYALEGLKLFNSSTLYLCPWLWDEVQSIIERRWRL
jgi:protease-4